MCHQKLIYLCASNPRTCSVAACMNQVIHSMRTEAKRGSCISKRRQCSVAVVMAENRNRFSAIARVTYACSLALHDSCNPLNAYRGTARLTHKQTKSMLCSSWHVIITLVTALTVVVENSEIVRDICEHSATTNATHNHRYAQVLSNYQRDAEVFSGSPTPTLQPMLSTFTMP